jgi:hypothetical protein
MVGSKIGKSMLLFMTGVRCAPASRRAWNFGDDA